MRYKTRVPARKEKILKTYFVSFEASFVDGLFDARIVFVEERNVL